MYSSTDCVQNMISFVVVLRSKLVVNAHGKTDACKLICYIADKSLARPGKKQSRKHIRDGGDFNNIETRAVIKFFSILCLTTDVSIKVMRKNSVTSARSPRNTSAQPGDRYDVTSR